MNIQYNEQGLVPVIVQDVNTLEVLMLAYMNEEALETTIATKEMTYFSRPRQELWKKGETSGHVQFLEELRYDCDEDTLLAKVRQVGAACHTGNRSCFYRTEVEGEAQSNTILPDLFRVIQQKKASPDGGYTNYLFDKGVDKILKKVGEETAEVIIAAKNNNDETIYEISDLLYHLFVLMVDRGIELSDVLDELKGRRK
jgi:phosphoribosyl-ATP pyrophosphohydrolase/phosphoribosyl-AMP cyclohydrolase